jgi:transcriptional regulator with XRE-family HTH domain
MTGVFEPTERSLMIGRRLKKLRKMNGLTQEQAVARAGLMVADTTLSRLELGQRLARDGELYALAKAYGVTLQHITRQDSKVDDPTFQLGDVYHHQPLKSQPEAAPAAAAIPKPGPHLTVGHARPSVVNQPTVMSSIPSGLPPQRSSSAVMTPSEYVEKVYVPSLERRVQDLEAKLERANQMLKANGYQQVLL